MEGAATSYNEPLEEGDVCRVCRSGAPEDGELFWPCQCSGSMRFVHETCLNDWIAARGSSPNPKCELCHTSLTFTKVFAPHMPSRLPLHLLLKHLVWSIGRVIVFIVRATLVATSWLAVLPYVIVWSFRLLLWTADSLGTVALVLAGRSAKELRDPSAVGRVGSTIKMVKSAVESTSKPIEELKDGIIANITAVSINWTTGEKTLVLEKTAQALQKAEEVIKCQAEAARGISVNPIGNLTALAARQTMLKSQGAQLTQFEKIADAFISDTIKGQILTSVVVVLFVVGFLLREWILMNGPVAALPPQPQPAVADAALVHLQAGEIAAVVAHLQARAEEEGRAAAEPPAAAAPPPVQAPREAWQAYLEGLAEGARAGQAEQEQLEQRLRDRDAQVALEQEVAEEQPVASTSRVQLGQSPSPFESSRALAEADWEDISDQEVASALIPGRSRARARMEDSDDEEAAGPVRSGLRGSPEAARRRRDERDQREERARRRANRQASAGPSFPAAPPSPDRPIRPLPGSRSRSTTPFDEGLPFVDAAPQQPVEPQQPPVPDQPPPPIALRPEIHLDALPVAQANNDALPPLIINQEQLEEGDEVFVEDIFDDLDGILEAVGMKGSLLTLVQNMGLMILLIVLCLAGGVWLPLCLGRVLAATNAVRVVAMPLRAVRTVSDPLFDAVFSLAAAMPKFAFRLVAPCLIKICPSLPSAAVDICIEALSASSTAVAEVTSTAGPAIESSLTSNSTSIAQVARPVAATALKQTLATVIHHWNRMAVDDDPFHRGLCIALGYGAALLAGVWYLACTTNDHRQEWSRAIREGVKQQITLLKVCLFVFVEIIVFPATCGAFLNLVTLPLFPHATIASRLAFHLRAPVSAFFISWITGTLFMFMFASSIDVARGAVREGLVWFIRDPQAAEFHPIREILERSSRTQARKIATSAILYGVVIASTLGTTILFLKLAGVLPLRWPASRSFSLPIDMVAYHFLVPLTMRIVDPRDRVRKMILSLTKRTAHALRLSSFIFGHRDIEEEGTHVRRTWHARLTLKKADINDVDEEGSQDGTVVSPKEVVFRRDGGFGRVPAIDTVRVAPKRPMLVRVTEEGHPIDDAGAAVIAAQLVEMATTRKNDSYRVVYLPPDFRARICLFIYLLWFTSSLALCGAIVAPLFIGRYLFSYITESEVHDLYSFAIGAYALGSLGYLIHHRWTILSPRITQAHVKAARSLLTFVALMGFVLPTLMSFTALAFLRLPFSLLSTSTTAEPPTIYLLHCWATGSVALSILYRLGRWLFPRPHPLRIDHDRCRDLFAQGSFLSMGEAAQLANSYLFAIAKHLAMQLVAPYALSILWTAALSPHSPAEGRITPNRRVIAAAYALTGVAFAVGSVSRQGKHIAKGWVQRKLEETYLVEKRLRNFEKVAVVES